MAPFAAHNDRFWRSGRTVVLGWLLATLLIALPVVGSLSSDPAQASSSSELSGQLSDVRAELEQVRENIQKAANARKNAQNDIAALDQSIVAADEALNAADSARDAAEEELAALRDELAQVTRDLTAKRQELDETEDDLVGQQEVFNDRLVNTYKSDGGVEYLEILLESASLVDVLGRLDMLGDIVEEDNRILEQIRALKALVEDQKFALENEQARVSLLEEQQVSLTADLQAAAELCETSLDELESARAAKKKVLAAAQKEEAAWKAQEDELLAESERIKEMLKAAAAAAAAKPIQKGSGVLAWPAPGDVTSGFGYRIHPIFNVRMMHTGIDIDADMSDPIIAAAGGTVLSAGWRGGYGKCVVISHGGGLATLYGHMSEILVSAGDKVGKGEVIGKVGSTGYSTGPHLHFEVRVNGEPVDPLGYL